MSLQRRRSKDDSQRDDRGTTATDMAAALGNNARRSWQESFEALVAYKGRHGNCLVPSQYGVDTALGHWVRKQRRNENEGKLPEEKRELLDEIGFAWKLRGEGNEVSKTSPRRPRSWLGSYEALVEFHEKHGHCNVPRRYHDDLSLGQFVSKQRQEQDKLTRNQRKLLEDLGFDFEMKYEKLDRIWNEKFEALKEYMKEHGDTRVPYNYPVSPGLGPWVSEQRRCWIDGRILPKRLRALQSIGFEKTVHSASTASLGNSSTSSPGTSMRENRSSPNKNNEKRRMKHNEKFMEQYRALQEFVRNNGHTVVPRKHNAALSHWVQRQRNLYSQNKLKPERMRLLKELGFDWDQAGEKRIQTKQLFGDMVGKLLDFQRDHGHVNVPRTYEADGLWEWVQEKKKEGENGSMNPRQVERLFRAGFTWEETYAMWIEKFDHVQEMVEECRCNQDADLALGTKLTNWVKTQFLFIEYDLLPPKRREKFESLGLSPEGSRITLDKTTDSDALEPRMEMTPEQSQWNGQNLKNAALRWDPYDTVKDNDGGRRDGSRSSKEKRKAQQELSGSSSLCKQQRVT